MISTAKMDSGGDILQFCRLCLVKDDVNIPIFEEQADIRQIFLKISSCLPVKVSREDKLPKKICDGCSYKLDMIYEFWNTTANAEKQLLAWLGEAGKIADDSSAAQQLKSVETFVKQEEIDPSEENDDKSYMFQQKLTVEEAGPSATVTSNEEEPPPKRARRTAAVKAQIAMDPESDDDDDSGEPMTKVEDESEDSDGDDHDPPFVDVPSTSADDQPGPSGMGKDGVEAPLDDKFHNTDTAETGHEEQNTTNTPKVYYCTICKNNFDINHTCPKSKFLCIFCKMPLNNRTVNVHKCFKLYTIEDLDSPSCELCGLQIPKTELHFHQEICEYGRKSLTKYPFFDDRGDDQDRTYRCKTCKLTFDGRSAYRKHRYELHDDQRSICFRCGKAVMNLNQHVKSVHGNPNAMKCELCDKTFSCTKHLNRHKLVHSNEFKYQCQKCGKGLKTSFSLKVHLRSHDTVKPFQCTVCLKTFTTKQWRDSHLKTHKLIK